MSGFREFSAGIILSIYSYLGVMRGAYQNNNNNSGLTKANWSDRLNHHNIKSTLHESSLKINTLRWKCLLSNCANGFHESQDLSRHWLFHEGRIQLQSISINRIDLGFKKLGINSHTFNINSFFPVFCMIQIDTWMAFM